jgi:hypothetical protein
MNTALKEILKNSAIGVGVAFVTLASILLIFDGWSVKEICMFAAGIFLGYTFIVIIIFLFWFIDKIAEIIVNKKCKK